MNKTEELRVNGSALSVKLSGFYLDFMRFVSYGGNVCLHLLSLTMYSLKKESVLAHVYSILYSIFIEIPVQ